MKIKGKLTTQRKVVNNLLRYYNLATPEEIETGKNWYHEANAFCKQLGDQYGHELWKVAGIIAALSPQTQWPVNKEFARSFISSRGRAFIHQRDRTIKAKKIFNTDDPYSVHDLLAIKHNSGLKTKAFYRNIVLPDYCDTVTVDRHALATTFQRPHKTYAIADRDAKITPKQYRFISDCYTLAAKKVGMTPSAYQATIWTTYRRLRGLEKPPIVEDGYKPMDIEDF